ncbi:lytic murein transglycosylase [Achromatium sp. WMS2]|nr:lytic murein transglycosylase [Achromatium sp. WMS2]
MLLFPGYGWLTPQERQPLVEAFVNEMVTKHGFERNQMMTLMYQARFRKDIISAMERPAESKPWYQYRSIFLTPSRIDGGVKFWRDNEAILTSVSSKYGVPPEIIIAIIGVETKYGQNIGTYKVLDALSTLAFGYPKRASFFRKELTELFFLDREENLLFVNRVGSYAGALGMPQFMPSSYRVYAVDGDSDGVRDLWRSNADVIASVANYFKAHGWRNKEPIARQATVATDPPNSLLDKGAKPSLSLATLARSKVAPEAIPNTPPLDPKTPANLIRLDGDMGYEYWLGFQNFYVITRYNHSNLYAMAVYQLSQRILALNQTAPASKP